MNTATKLWIAGIGIALSSIALSSHANAAPVEEDSPGWSCVDDGNRVCGPDNANGVPAGLYDEGGVLVLPWSEMDHGPNAFDESGDYVGGFN